MSTSIEPVSAFLEQKLLSTLNEKKLLVWLDAEGAYSGFVDGLRARAESHRFPVPVLAYRGSFLELMLALEHAGSTIDPPLLLVHLPGHNNLPAAQSDRSVRRTPLLELYETAHPFQQNLSSLVSEAANGRLPLPEIEAFAASPQLSLSAADAWLAKAGARSGGGHQEWISQLSPPELINQLTGTAADRLEDITPALKARAEALFGVDAQWFQTLPGLVEATIGWLLCVEFVHDLRRPPLHPDLLRLKPLPEKTVQRCQQEAARLRQQQAERYRGWALSIEQWLDQRETTTAKDLGKIDTFRFEALTIFRGAVQALCDRDHSQARAWFEQHEASQGFWVQLPDEQPRKWAWSLIGDAACLGLALDGAGQPLKGVTSLEEAIECYVRLAAPVDAAHRQFEQRYAAVYDHRLPEISDLNVAFDQLRRAWSDWADALAKDFARVCRAHGGLPPPELQQRSLFDQVVLPLVRPDEKVALFMLDALRFEMALELRDAFTATGVQVDLRARLAELPTITAVGMNALAPIERNGRLVPLLKEGRFTGFRAGETSVARPEDRVNAIRARTAGKAPLQLNLQDITEGSAARLKNQVAQANLVVVHGLDVDAAGESGFGVRVFADILRDVISARHLLEAAGVQHFVFTADHGFLLQRGARTFDFGSRGQADRRYALSDTDRQDLNHLSISLQSLGYDAPGYLVVREDLAEYDVGRAPGSFTHGGNSLQERVIPVLTLSRKRAPADTGVRLKIELEASKPILGVQRLKVRVSPSREHGQAALDFASAKPVEVLLRVPDRGDVTVRIKDVDGAGATVLPAGFAITPGLNDFVEVYFTLEGPAEGRCPVQFVLVNSPDVVAESPLAYPVHFVPVPAKTQSAAAATAVNRVVGSWAERLGDPDAGKVFEHLETHGSLNEGELVQLLGNHRRARAFAIRFDSFRDKLTFEVELIATSDGKRYQRL